MRTVWAVKPSFKNESHAGGTFTANRGLTEFELLGGIAGRNGQRKR